VELDPLPRGSYADTFFGLREELERLFGRAVDMIVCPIEMRKITQSAKELRWRCDDRIMSLWLRADWTE
jgi:hypothetical protein